MSATETTWKQPQLVKIRVSGVYGLLLLDVVSRWDITMNLICPISATSEQLTDPNYRIPTPIANELGETRFAPNGWKHRLALFGRKCNFDSWFHWLRHYDRTWYYRWNCTGKPFHPITLCLLQLYFFSRLDLKPPFAVAVWHWSWTFTHWIILDTSIGIMTMTKALTGIEDLKVKLI